MPDAERILMIEDDPDIQTVARMALETMGGFAVHTCSSGREALQVAPQVEPHCILLDVMMPDMDGPATLTELRKNPLLADVPVIFMTAKVMPEEVRHYTELGAVGIIPKPFDPMTLASEVRAILERAG
jgi:CheY-like chemotaxis protein